MKTVKALCDIVLALVMMVSYGLTEAVLLVLRLLADAGMWLADRALRLCHAVRKGQTAWFTRLRDTAQWVEK